MLCSGASQVDHCHLRVRDFFGKILRSVQEFQEFKSFKFFDFGPVVTSFYWRHSSSICWEFGAPPPGGINEYEVDLGNEDEVEVLLNIHQFLMYEVQLMNWPKPEAGHLPWSDID
jgi:hypothetical protein